MGNQRNLGPLLIILVVLLVAVGAYYTKEGKWPSLLSKFGLSAERNFTLAQELGDGRVIEDFPVEFLGVVRDAKVFESAKYVSRNEEEEILTARYTTAASVADMFAAYVNFLTEEGYTLTLADVQGSTTVVAGEGEEGLVTVEMSIRNSRSNEAEVSVRRAMLE